MPDAKKLIGEVRWADAEGVVRQAFLETSGRWTCDNKVVEDYLQGFCNPVDVTLPGMQFGDAALRQAAKAIGGHLIHHLPVPIAEENVYY